MTSDPDTVPVPDRRLVDVNLVRRLIARQFPQWADLPVRPVATSGWDNQTFHLGDRMSIRLPTAREYALAVDKEHQWLPIPAPQVPLPIPLPLALGEPDEGLAFHWSVYEWIDGDPVRIDSISDMTEFAVRLAGFVVALRHIDPTGGPEPGLHNWFRGGPLQVYDSQTRRAIDVLGNHVPREAVTEIWQSALRAAWDGRPVWFHGDVAPGNILIRDGAIAAVIDFGTRGVGDPACDLAIAWTFLSGPDREAFRARINVDPGTWARGRGWALWKALITYARALHSDRAAAAEVKRVIDEILTEYAESGGIRIDGDVTPQDRHQYGASAKWASDPKASATHDDYLQPPLDRQLEISGPCGIRRPGTLRRCWSGCCWVVEYRGDVVGVTLAEYFVRRGDEAALRREVELLPRIALWSWRPTVRRMSVTVTRLVEWFDAGPCGSPAAALLRGICMVCGRARL